MPRLASLVPFLEVTTVTSWCNLPDPSSTLVCKSLAAYRAMLCVHFIAKFPYCRLVLYIPGSSLSIAVWYSTIWNSRFYRAVSYSWHFSSFLLFMATNKVCVCLFMCRSESLPTEESSPDSLEMVMGGDVVVGYGWERRRIDGKASQRSRAGTRL